MRRLSGGSGYCAILLMRRTILRNSGIKKKTMWENCLMRRSKKSLASVKIRFTRIFFRCAKRLAKHGIGLIGFIKETAHCGVWQAVYRISTIFFEGFVGLI